MTYRERRERRAEQRRDWAASRTAKADAAHAKVHAIADGIPFGQPILVGHHSEGRARRDQARMESGMRASVDNSRAATRHEQAADEIERQLRNSIYSDDEDAVERLNEKIERLTVERDRKKATNAAFRKEHRGELVGLSAWEKEQRLPHRSFEVTNLTANIARLRKRAEHLERQKVEGVRYRMMEARYGGQCDRCGKTVEKGETIYWNRSVAERLLCSDCGEER